MLQFKTIDEILIRKIGYILNKWVSFQFILETQNVDVKAVIISFMKGFNITNI